MKKSNTLVLVALIVMVLSTAGWTADMGTAFTYQGQLSDTGSPADGEYDFEFKLYDDPNTVVGVQKGSTVTKNEVDVADGFFTVNLDFGGTVFAGDARWLEVGVRPGAWNDPNEYTTLSPRQEITPTPYALHAGSVSVPLILSGSLASGEAIIESTNTGSGSSTGYAVKANKYNRFYGYLGYSEAGVYGREEWNWNIGMLGTSNYGVRGTAQDGVGVSGLSHNSYGVWGGHTSTLVNFGYLGSDIFGAFGKHENSGNYGGLGCSDKGVYGYSNTGGRGVYGWSGSNYGVEGTSTTSHGVHGSSYSSYGVYGINSDSGNFGYIGGSNIGVYGWGGSGDYDFYAGGPGTNYGATSSIRWKSNVQNIDKPLEKLVSLRGVYFNWDNEHGGHHDVGMIAEEVGKVLPEIVDYEDNGVDAIGMDYSKLTPLLVEAVKQLKAENDLLKQRLDALEKTITQQRSIRVKEIHDGIN